LAVKKRILRSDALRGIACWFIAQYVRLVWATGRWRVVGAERPAGFWNRGEAFILAFWHGQLLMMPCCWRRGVEMRMLISQHDDGELIARTIGHFGLGAVRGSSKRSGKAKEKGGAAALRSIVKHLKEGRCVGITPDGPRGPRMRAGDGVAVIARLSGAPVLPVACATSRRRLLGTWDRFAVPLPFARGVFVGGEPLGFSRADDEEEARQRIEAALNRTTAEANRLAGAPAVEPAPA
jgi:lysophospholipid acyltransferase (LPLAT)-like uncharacterized protein